MRITSLLTATAASALLAFSAAYAGGYTPPVAEKPVVAAPTSPVANTRTNTWSGFYAGMQMSYSDFSVNIDGTDDATGGVYGIHAGYNHQLNNNMVLGGEITYDHSSAESDVWEVERLMSARAKVGYARDRWMVYAFGGLAHIRTEGRVGRGHGKSKGAVYGVGFDYAMTPKWTLGGSWEAYRFDDFKHDRDEREVDGGSVKVKASYHF